MRITKQFSTETVTALFRNSHWSGKHCDRNIPYSKHVGPRNLHPTGRGDLEVP